jgi:hypothetical protein
MIYLSKYHSFGAIMWFCHISLMNANSMLPQSRARRNRRNRGQSSESNILTGGSRDYKPEYMTLTASAANNVSASTAYPLPVLRNFSSGNGSRAQIVEALKVIVEFPEIYAAAAVYSDLRFHLSTKNHGTAATTLADPDTFVALGFQSYMLTSGNAISPSVLSFDFTDGMGNGILLATDNIYAQLSNVATGQTITVSAKLIYRIYSASVTEYVGIVQSQQ